MGLVRNAKPVTDDPYTDASSLDTVPAAGAVIVSLEQWQREREALLARRVPLGIRLRSEQSPLAIAADLAHLAVIALEFPKFRDGRAYSHARVLRERLGYRGEIRAVGEVLQEQLHYMARCGFDAFEIRDEDPVRAWQTAASDHSVWYQRTGDGRRAAPELRARARA